MAKTIDMTPTWVGILPALLAVLESSPNTDSRQLVRTELKRMAALADRYVISQKGIK
jgi:hypothetical protein